jgi:molecular chaperone DnaK
MDTNIIGIDLGTTMSGIAKLNNIGKPEIIPNSEGERMTPSVILFKSSKDLKIGKTAKFGAAEYPDRVAKEFKREMENTDFSFSVEGKDFSAPELSSFVLKKMIDDAEKELGKITDVVISVPAYFKEVQRNATMEAGKLAGVNVLAIINEPTAAALYYSSMEKVNGKCIVYDLGGGTFDVTIVAIEGQSSEIITSIGDAHLGGIDFDKALLQLLQEKYHTEKGTPLFAPDDKSEYEEFLLLAEELKKKLSSSPEVKQKLKGAGGRCIVSVSADEFKDTISTYIARTEMLVEQALEEANLTSADIDNILLVGGSTRIPAIKDSISELIGKKPVEKVNVDEAVALGAAIKAGLALSNSTMKLPPKIAQEMDKLCVKEVTNHSYGTIALSYDNDLGENTDSNSIIIKKNTPLPCSKTKTFFTHTDNQTSINIRITQGEGTDPDLVDIIHQEAMTIPGDRPKNQPIEVTYSYDENQLMHCTFKDVNADIIIEMALSMDNKNRENTINVDNFLIG